MLTAAVGVVAAGELDWTKPITIINRLVERERDFFFYFLLLSPCGKRCLAERETELRKRHLFYGEEVGERDQQLGSCRLDRPVLQH